MDRRTSAPASGLPDHVVAWRAGRPQRDPLAAIDDLAQRVPAAYVHVDLDALDPGIAPGVVDAPVPGGLSLEDAEGAVRAVAERVRIAAAALTTYLPDRDEDDRTLHAQLRLVDVVTQATG